MNGSFDRVKQEIRKSLQRGIAWAVAWTKGRLEQPLCIFKSLYIAKFAKGASCYAKKCFCKTTISVQGPLLLPDRKFTLVTSRWIAIIHFFNLDLFLSPSGIFRFESATLVIFPSSLLPRASHGLWGRVINTKTEVKWWGSQCDATLLMGNMCLPANTFLHPSWMIQEI